MVMVVASCVTVGNTGLQLPWQYIASRLRIFLLDYNNWSTV